MRVIYAVRLIGAVLALSGCASFAITDTKPLTQAEMAQPGSFSISDGGYRLPALPPHAEAPDLLVLVAMSGGGKRSSSFAYGALTGMRETMVPAAGGPVSLLSQLSGISGVSGGSFPAAYYGLYRDAAFGRFETDFLYDDTNAYIYGVYLLPWNWTWIVDPSVGTNDFMARVYDRTMFRGATYSDLVAKGRPLIAVGATDVSYGAPFLFTQENFDLICASMDSFPLARAVAASNGFPGLFSPVTLTSRTADCGGRKPGWLEHVTAAEVNDPLSRLGRQAVSADRYLDPQQTSYLHLVDGGVSDNLALRAAEGLMLVSAADIRATLFTSLRRILVISVDGQGGQDTSVARRKAVGGIFSLLGLVTGNQIDSYNFDTLVVMSEQLKELQKAIVQARCAQRIVADGTRCDDVKAVLLHLSLSGMPESPEKQKLLAIPTGLTVAREDVDLLIKAGHDAVTGSAELRDFLADYPSVPASSPTRVGAVRKSAQR
jgi:NTE family protein